MCWSSEQPARRRVSSPLRTDGLQFIGLASVSSAEIEERAELPESFYRFFADEVFSALSADVQQGLTTLAVAPMLDRELAVSLLGSDAAETVCAAALDVGLLVERDAQLDLHPLARMFLEERSAQLGLTPAPDATRTCLESYRERREWDAAFELIVSSDVVGELEDLMHDALDELLDGARLATTQRWCDVAAFAGVEAPVFALTRAEMMLREGRYVEAVAHAESAALGGSQLEFRALSLAGRAAHLASREEYALALYERAEKIAASERERRDAKWGQVGCLIDLELPSSAAALRELADGVSFGDPRELVRAADQGLYFQLRQGALDLDDADIASQILATVGDPLVKSSFLSAYANALALTARYEEALAAAEALQLTAEQFRFDFALPYGLCAAAMAHTGSRRWQDAEVAASKALSKSRASRDVHAELLSCSVLLRLYAQQGRFASGFELDLGRMRYALKASIGEVACSRALLLACAGRLDDAIELVDEVRGTTTAVELVVLAPAVDAICALRSGASDIVERVTTLESAAFQTGAVDLLVTTYRACPELLSILLRATEGRRFRELVERVGDEDLAKAVGHPIAVNDDKRLLLSRRETDVFELLRTGLTNREIGRLLFIEESTVKAHTHRIYDKLGVHSRSALAVQAALERSIQATSATDSMSSENDSS